MNISLKPAALTLVGNMNHLKVSCNHKSGNSSPYEDISFTISKQGSSTPIVERVLSPDKNGFVEIDLFDIVYPELTFSFSNVSEPYRQNDIVKTFTIQLLGITTAETATWTFTAIRAGVDRLADSADNFLQQNFLTWQPNIKGVTYYSPEFLTYYASVASVVKCKARVGNNDVSLTLANISAGRAYTIPVGYAIIAGKVNGLPSYYDVWVEVSGTRVTYIQRYYAQDMKSENEQWILFENSLGGVDTFRAYGNLEMNADHSHNVAEIDETSTEFRVDTTRKFKKNTGRLDLKERRWLLDFFPSLKRYIYIGDYLRQIVVTDSDVNYKSSDLPSQYNFTYKYADAKPYLNLPRTDTPLEVLHIDVPEVGSFTVAPRLVEFPRTQLSSGALFPVQDPYSESWGATTLGAIVQYFIQYVLNNYSGGGTFGHVHSNFDFLELLSEQKIRDFIKKHGTYFFLSKEHNDTAHGEITFEYLTRFGNYLRGAVNSGAGITAEGLGDFINLRVLGRVLGSLTVENVAHAASMVFSSVMKSQGAINGFIGGKGIYMDALAGLIQADGLEIRGFMRIMELIINQLQLMRSDYSFTEGGVVEHVEPAGNGYYVLTMRKEHDNDMTPFKEGDIIYGIVNNLLEKKVYVNGSAPDYYRTWAHVIQGGVDTEANTLTVAFYNGDDVQGGHNFTPAGTEVFDGWEGEPEGYDTDLNITRHGNDLYDIVEGVKTARYPDRQSAWVLSTTDKRLSFFWNVDKPVIEEYNYALVLGILPDLSNLPSTRDRNKPSLYIDTLFYEHSHVIHFVTPPEYRVVNMGGWYQGMEARNGLVEYDDGTSAYVTWEVSHMGLQWLCATDHTTTAPHWRNPDWQCLSAAQPELRIQVSKRFLRVSDFTDGRVGTTLAFRMLLGNSDVTADVLKAEAVWTRQSVDADQDPAIAALDQAWNQRHASGNLTLPITNADLPPNWLTAKRVRFTCTVTIAGIAMQQRSLNLYR